MLRLLPTRWTVPLERRAEHESLRPDVGRALRGTLAVMALLVLAAFGRLPVDVWYAVLAAQNIAMVDVRGAYSLRFTLLLSMVVILTATAGLGGLVAHSLGWTLAAMAVVAVCAGLWRHLSADYGPSVGVASVLLYSIAVVTGASGPTHIGLHVLGTMTGGLLGVALQTVLWPFKPQHPLRKAVAESWLAVADVFCSLNPENPAPGRLPEAQSREQAEASMRQALDDTRLALSAAHRAHKGPMVRRLQDLNEAAARMSTLAGALGTALEGLRAQPGAPRPSPALIPVLTALGNASRSAALAVVSRQPTHLALFELRVRRNVNLIRVLEGRLALAQGLAGPEHERAQIAEILRLVREHLPVVAAALRGTVDRADEKAAVSLELLDLSTWTFRPLTAALNFRLRPDPALVRHTLRMIVLTTAALAAVRLLHLPHGYWVPFTMVVVLQTDYGSTRTRAAQRLAGTLLGGVLASAILGLHLPLAAALLATAATSFLFIYWLKRRYGLAVVFITIFVVLLTETGGPVTLAFTLERLADTMAGGLLALGAALVFWPTWERSRLPPILAAALRANRDFLRLLTSRIRQGGGFDPEVIRAKQGAEKANSAVFSSLQRMSGDPRSVRDRLQWAAALANGNQRFTRAITVVSLHLKAGAPAGYPAFSDFTDRAAEGFDALADRLESHGLEGGDGGGPGGGRARSEALAPRLGGVELPEFGTGTEPGGQGATGAGDPEQHRLAWISGQLGRAGAELSAMLLA